MKNRGIGKIAAAKYFEYFNVVFTPHFANTTLAEVFISSLFCDLIQLDCFLVKYYFAFL